MQCMIHEIVMVFALLPDLLCAAQWTANIEAVTRRDTDRLRQEIVDHMKIKVLIADNSLRLLRGTKVFFERSVNVNGRVFYFDRNITATDADESSWFSSKSLDFFSNPLGFGHQLADFYSLSPNGDSTLRKCMFAPIFTQPDEELFMHKRYLTFEEKTLVDKYGMYSASLLIEDWEYDDTIIRDAEMVATTNGVLVTVKELYGLSKRMKRVYYLCPEETFCCGLFCCPNQIDMFLVHSALRDKRADVCSKLSAVDVLINYISKCDSESDKDILRIGRISLSERKISIDSSRASSMLNQCKYSLYEDGYFFNFDNLSAVYYTCPEAEMCCNERLCCSQPWYYSLSELLKHFWLRLLHFDVDF